MWMRRGRRKNSSTDSNVQSHRTLELLIMLIMLCWSLQFNIRIYPHFWVRSLKLKPSCFSLKGHFIMKWQSVWTSSYKVAYWTWLKFHRKIGFRMCRFQGLDIVALWHCGIVELWQVLHFYCKKAPFLLKTCYTLHKAVSVITTYIARWAMPIGHPFWIDARALCSFTILWNQSQNSWSWWGFWGFIPDTKYLREM